jgi:ribosomal protein RSM22 (predicted rRNA methylase)
MRALSTPDALLTALEAELERVSVPRGAQIAALRQLFALFTTERRTLRRYRYLDVPRLRLAYLRYHLPLNTVRSLCVLRDLLSIDPAVAELAHVFDLGAGPGSSTLATYLTLEEATQREYVLADHSRSGLRAARQLLCASAAALGRAPPRTRTLEIRLPALPDVPGPALVWLSMVLNELDAPGRRGLDLERLFADLARKLPAGSVVAIVEPALRAPGRRLLELHSFLLESGDWQVLAPCTHQAPCPLLRARGRPWCHFHFAWQAGRVVEEVARPLGLPCDRASLAYLVLRRGPTSRSSAPPHPESLARVISDPMRVRGDKLGVYICRAGRRDTTTRLPPGAARGDVVDPEAPTRTARIVRAWPCHAGPISRSADQPISPST